MNRTKNRTRGAIVVSLYDSEDREVEVRATYSPGETRARWDRGIGTWLPPDPEDFEVLSVRAVDEGADVAEVEARTEEIEEAVREAATEAADMDWGEDDAREERWS